MYYISLSLYIYIEREREIEISCAGTVPIAAPQLEPTAAPATASPILIRFWPARIQNRIPFGDHPLKLERYRED